MGNPIAHHQSAITFTLKAGADLQDPSMLGRVLGIDGDFANTGREAFGVVLENVKSGEMVTVGIFGRLPFRSETTVKSAGYALTVASGLMTAAAAGTYIVGRSIGKYAGQSPGPNTNVGCGTLGECLFSPWAAPFVDNPASAGMTGNLGGY